MALNIAALTESILKRTDKSREDFVGFPQDSAETAANWAAVMREYFGIITKPPVPDAGPTAEAHDGAEALAAAAIKEQLDAEPPVELAGLVGLDNGFVVYAATIAAAVPGSVAPAGTPGVAGLRLPPVEDPTTPAGSIAAKVDAWAKTGTDSTGSLWA